MSEWEYKAVLLPSPWGQPKNLEADLKDLGRDGWELVAVTYDGSGFHSGWFKRPLPAVVTVRGKTVREHGPHSP